MPSFEIDKVKNVLIKILAREYDTDKNKTIDDIEYSIFKPDLKASGLKDEALLDFFEHVEDEEEVAALKAKMQQSNAVTNPIVSDQDTQSNSETNSSDKSELKKGQQRRLDHAQTKEADRMVKKFVKDYEGTENLTMEKFVSKFQCDISNNEDYQKYIEVVLGYKDALDKLAKTKDGEEEEKTVSKEEKIKAAREFSKVKTGDKELDKFRREILDSVIKIIKAETHVKTEAEKRKEDKAKDKEKELNKYLDNIQKDDTSEKRSQVLKSAEKNNKETRYYAGIKAKSNKFLNRKDELKKLTEKDLYEGLGPELAAIIMKNESLKVKEKEGDIDCTYWDLTKIHEIIQRFQGTDFEVSANDDLKDNEFNIIKGVLNYGNYKFEDGKYLLDTSNNESVGLVETNLNLGIKKDKHLKKLIKFCGGTIENKRESTVFKNYSPEAVIAGIVAGSTYTKTELNVDIKQISGPISQTVNIPGVGVIEQVVDENTQKTVFRILHNNLVKGITVGGIIGIIASLLSTLLDTQLKSEKSCEVMSEINELVHKSHNSIEEFNKQLDAATTFTESQKAGLKLLAGLSLANVKDCNGKDVMIEKDGKMVQKKHLDEATFMNLLFQVAGNDTLNCKEANAGRVIDLSKVLKYEPQAPEECVECPECPEDTKKDETEKPQNPANSEVTPPGTVTPGVTKKDCIDWCTIVTNGHTWSSIVEKHYPTLKAAVGLSRAIRELKKALAKDNDGNINQARYQEVLNATAIGDWGNYNGKRKMILDVPLEIWVDGTKYIMDKCGDPNGGNVTVTNKATGAAANRKISMIEHEPCDKKECQ